MKELLDSVLVGDCKKSFERLGDECCDLIITSPPYFNQREYSGKDGHKAEIGREDKVDKYIDTMMEVFAECLRVTKKTGSIVFNVGDKYVDQNLMLVPYQFALAVRKTFPEVRLINTVTWVKVNPTPRQYDRRLVSGTEPFFHFVKSGDYKFDVEAITAPGPELKANPNRKVGQKYFEMIERAEKLNEEEKENARKALTETVNRIKEGKLHGLRMKIRGMHQLAFGGQEGGRNTQIIEKGFSIIETHGKKQQPDYFTFTVAQTKGMKHPAIFPIGLVEKFIKLTTEEGDVVLDPFIGSGTTGLAAKRLKRHYIGFELYPEYAKLAEARIAEQIKFGESQEKTEDVPQEEDAVELTGSEVDRAA